jgi:hypothetical protein
MLARAPIMAVWQNGNSCKIGEDLSDEEAMRPSLRLVLAAGLVALVAVPAVAKNGYTVYAYGALSCGDWVADHEAVASVRVGNEDSWLAGFITAMDGMNAAEGYVEFANPQVTLGGMTAWLTNYCRSNPLTSVSDAALALCGELMERRAKGAEDQASAGERKFQKEIQRLLEQAAHGQ